MLTQPSASDFIFPADSAVSRPFHLGPETDAGPMRIGGTMPAGLTVSLRASALYFGTFPLYADATPLYFSLFVNCPFAELVLALNAGWQTDDRVVVVTHAPLPRSTDPRFAAKLSAHSLHIGPPQLDELTNEAGEKFFRERHKFGGRPYGIQEPVLPGLDDLLAQGYRQLLQIDFPNLDDGAVAGSWPFGDGIFNLFWRYPFAGEPYYWYLQG